jgi:predicted nucleic acid-binding protein
VVAREAGRLAVDHPLSGADAVHLASALQLTDDVIVATWDHRLHAAAVASGLTVVPARVD